MLTSEQSFENLKDVDTIISRVLNQYDGMARAVQYVLRNREDFTETPYSEAKKTWMVVHNEKTKKVVGFSFAWKVYGVSKFLRVTRSPNSSAETWIKYGVIHRNGQSEVKELTIDYILEGIA